ncbi:MAG: AmmeMemoRadiSam system protein B [Treponema sp.]|nr:AmmeMemoRadiSam system protein B [Treponema sp.]
MEAALAQKRRIRSPVGAGMFYPEDRGEILECFRSYSLIERETDTLEKNLPALAQAIIAPHGAWSYSGALAAEAFSSAMDRRGKIRKIVLLGPIHDKRENGLFLSNSHSFFTPLGNILVNHEVSEELKFNSKYFEINDIPHLTEHSIEILLPFIKYCFPDASIIPILMGQPKTQYIYDLGQALKKVIAPILDETLIVVSCNLSCDPNPVIALHSAEECIRLFSKKNAQELSAAFFNGSLNSCGGALVAGLFESGLLDKTRVCSVAKNLSSAVGTENNTVYYSRFSYI